MPPGSSPTTTVVPWIIRTAALGPLSLPVARLRFRLFARTIQPGGSLTDVHCWVDTGAPLSVVPFQFHNLASCGNRYPVRSPPGRANPARWATSTSGCRRTSPPIHGARCPSWPSLLTAILRVLPSPSCLAWSSSWPIQQALVCSRRLSRGTSCFLENHSPRPLPRYHRPG
jgi:hypothetical protein